MHAARIAEQLGHGAVARVGGPELGGDPAAVGHFVALPVRAVVGGVEASEGVVGVGEPLPRLAPQLVVEVVVVLRLGVVEPVGERSTCPLD